MDCGHGVRPTMLAGALAYQIDMAPDSHETIVPYSPMVTPAWKWRVSL